MGNVLFMTSAILTGVWGSAHLIATNSVVAGFGDISQDNKHIITMVWIVEGISLIFIGILVGVITLIDSTDIISKMVYFLSADVLVVLATISLFTGFKAKQLPFKLCPFIFGVAAVLIFVGIIV